MPEQGAAFSSPLTTMTTAASQRRQAAPAYSLAACRHQANRPTVVSSTEMTDDEKA
jgi:hypothetical protein